MSNVMTSPSKDRAEAHMAAARELIGEIDAVHVATADAILIIRDALAASFAEGMKRAAEDASKLERKVAARDRRIARLVEAIDYARSQGFRFPADDEPRVVLSEPEEA